MSQNSCSVYLPSTWCFLVLPLLRLVLQQALQKPLTGWVKTVDEEGFDALRPQQRPGHPSKLTDQQLKELDAVIQSDPKEHGLKVWDGPSLSSYIKSHYSVDIGIRQCQRLFRSLGYSHIRPQPYPSKGYEDTEERKAFKKNETR